MSALGIHRVPYDKIWNIKAHSEHEENDKSRKEDHCGTLKRFKIKAKVN